MSLSDSISGLTIRELQQKIVAGQFSVMEVTAYFLARIERFEPQLNAFVTVLKNDALKQAEIIDNEIRSGKIRSPLAGIPYALKDLFCADGIRTTCSSKMLSNFTAPYNATVTQKLADAGTILLGKTNMDEFAMGSSTETSYFGDTKNPWDLNKVPGGSSGGSATAVAARLAPFALGSDTGGSIRQPASYTGTTGIKPTYGSISRYGMIAFASSLDQCGPMAKSAEDMALTLQALAGFDEKDSTSVEGDRPNYSSELGNSVEGLKIGLPKQFFAEGLDQGVAEVIETAIEEYRKAGAIIKEIDLPNNHLGIPAYYVIAPAECSSNLARFDGVRYGHRCENPKDLLDLYERSRWEGFGEEVKRRIMIGTYALSAGYYDAYYLQAQKIRRLIKNDFAKAFEDVDVIMGPSAPSTAFNLGENTDDPIAMYMADIYTIPVSLAGLPGMSIPIGFSNKMPVGLQIIGNYFDEARLLNVAHQYQQNTDWHLQMPQQFA